MYDIFYVSKNSINDYNWNSVKSKYPTARKFENINSFDQLKKQAFTKMFWVVWDDLTLLDNLNLNTYRATQWDDMYVHVFKNSDHYDGVCLFPKSVTISQREFDNRFFTDKKEIDIVASIPLGYDKFNITTYDDYLNAVEQSSTDMFWAIWPDVNVKEDFKFNYKVPKHNSNIVHIFKNGEFFDGICLFPKNVKVSKREFYHRFFAEKKEIDIVASIPKQYNIYSPKTFDEYKQITDDMFWIVWPEVKIINNEIFDLYFSHHNTYDRRENHVFKNLCNYDESYLSGILLCSKFKPLTQEEFDKQYPTDKKEYNIIASKFQYPIYTITSYEQYLDICKTESQNMFWCVWPEIKILDDKLFDLYFDPNSGAFDYDRKENHVFKNLCNDKESFLNGVVLFSKEKIISKKEFNRRFLIDKKEHNFVASRYAYPVYNIDTYDDYKQIIDTESQPLFWAIWPEIEIIDSEIFNLYFEPNNGVYDYDRNINHVFQHKFRNELTYNGLMLMSTSTPVSPKEIDFRFLINKKQYEQVVSKHKDYDIIFVSYNEPNAEENYNKLINKFPRAKRVHGVKGIHQAHIKAAELATTDMFWVVDADAHIIDDFNFNHQATRYEKDVVHVWRSKNPINDLIYGYGGVQLLPRKLTLDMDVNTADMTTSISKKFKAMPIISNVSAFNTDPFNTWKSAFRECVKLSSRTISGQVDDETQNRLDIWCSVAKGNYAEDALAGAIAGRKYGEENKNNLAALAKINNFDWLKTQYGI
jgi:hypothetical protein